MRKRIVTLMTALAMLCSAAVPGMEPQAAQAKAETTGTTYYVSTLHGKDSNDGTSPVQPFYSLQKINHLTLKAGDRVLLECGSVFEGGYLHLFGQSGSAEAPIVIDRYGTGANPVINTNGEGVWFQNYGQRLDNKWHQYKGYVSSSILLYDSEYVEIQNLEIVNRNPDVDTAYNATDMMDRTGVAAVAQDGGTLDHIHLKNLNIHDVMGNVYNKHMNNGGIYFTAYLPHDAKTGTPNDNKADFISSETGVPRFNDVLIEGCSVINTNRWGIAVGYTVLWEKFDPMEISEETITKFGSTNVVVRNNYVKDSGGDAITLMYCHEPLVEYNVSDGAARQMNATDYTVTTQRVAAGIWPWKCKNAVFQYNEAFDTRNINNENNDGQAWDADWTDGTVYQYNYSHHNEGGCLMVCGIKAYQTTFRYNISQNDLEGVLDPCDNSPKAHIYNNTFYVAEGTSVYRNRSTGTAVLENNIFYYAGSGPKQENWTRSDNKTYSNNLYYNYANTPEDAAGIVAGKGTQVMVDPGTGPSAASLTGQAREHEDPDAANAFDGYKLSAGSPAIGAGKTIADANDYEPSKADFFGNDLTTVTTFDIGANQYQAKTSDVLQKPSKPVTGEMTDNTAEVSWVAPADAGIRGYKVMDGDKVILDLTGDALAAAKDGREIVVTLQKLKAGTEYNLTVVAYDKNGKESSPQPLAFKTTGIRLGKPSVPAQPSVSGITQTGATVSWTAAAESEKVTGYQIKNGNVALVDLTGASLASATSAGKITAKLTGLKAGTAYSLSLIARNVEEDYSEARAFTVKTANASTPVAATPSVKLDQASLTLYTKAKKTATLKAAASNFSGAVTWTSSDPKVATVSNGKVTAKKAGTTVITATAGSAKATCTVTVKKPSIKVKSSVKVKKGKKVKLNAKAAPSGKITYKSSKKKIATVTKKGVVKGVKKGSCTITVKCNGVTKKVKVKVK